MCNSGFELTSFGVDLLVDRKHLLVSLELIVGWSPVGVEVLAHSVDKIIGSLLLAMY